METQIENRENNTAPKRGGRIEVLDFLRGMDMLYILLCHAGLPHGATWYALLPFLFVISGYLEYRSGKCARTELAPYAKNAFLHLMVPYFFFELVVYLIYSVYTLISSGTIVPPLKALYAILTCFNTETYSGIGGHLYFLPCMFVSLILTWLILRLVRKTSGKADRPMTACFVIILLLLTWVTAYVIPGRPPMAIDSALFGTAFLLMGYVFGRGIDYLLEKNHIFFDVVISVSMNIIMLSTVFSERGIVWMHLNEYGEYLDSVVGAICGCIAAIIVGKWIYVLLVKYKIDFLKNFVLWYGKNSLVTFPVHMTIMWALKLTGLSVFSNWFVLFLATALLNIPVVTFFTKVFPFLTGTKKSTKPKAS